jgi:hypothetical protein
MHPKMFIACKASPFQWLVEFSTSNASRNGGEVEGMAVADI